MGPETFNFRKWVKTSGLNPAGLQGETQSPLLCLDRQAAIWTAGQMFMVLEKGSILGKVHHSCWEVYGSWLCYSTKLAFPSAGCNRITRGSDQVEAGPKGRLSASRESIIYQYFFSRAEPDVGLCTSVCGQFSASAQLQAERNCQKRRKDRGLCQKKTAKANRIPEDKHREDMNFRTEN